ncbi:5-oxoprolinase subunit PxpB [Constantimarinum furrinae]|nr:5-oxoprolinase subunit PxpB [Constantimarinum furrinae]
MKLFPKIKMFGAHSVLLSWESEINESTHALMLKWDRFLLHHYSEEIRETVITYTALAIYLHEFVEVYSFMDKLRSLQEISSTEIENGNDMIIQVPVCYAVEMAPDLKEVARKNKLTSKEVIALHSSPVYSVAFNGFLPGFPYLIGLPNQLITARKNTSRTHVEAGSVAIGGNQTGVYPTTSPGGWNVIGRSPLQFFNVNNDPPSLLTPGSKLRFYAITLQEFKRISKEIKEGVYHLKMEESYD